MGVPENPFVFRERASAGHFILSPPILRTEAVCVLRFVVAGWKDVVGVGKPAAISQSNSRLIIGQPGVGPRYCSALANGHADPGTWRDAFRRS